MSLDHTDRLSSLIDQLDKQNSLRILYRNMSREYSLFTETIMNGEEKHFTLHMECPLVTCYLNSYLAKLLRHAYTQL